MLSRHYNMINAFIHVVRVAFRPLIMSHGSTYSFYNETWKLGTDVYFTNSLNN